MRTGEVCRAIGITRTELAYWRRKGIVTPTERTAGGHHRFQGRDLLRVRRAMLLRRSGLSLRQVARALEVLEPDLDLLVEAIEARELAGVQGYGATWNSGAESTDP